MTPITRSRLSPVPVRGSARQSPSRCCATEYRVALAGRRREPLEQTAAESGRASQAFVVTADVTEESQVQALFAAVKERFGRIDLLFNNAGVFAPGTDYR